MTTLNIHHFIARRDNIGVLLHDPETGMTASIDAPDAALIHQELDAKGWRLTHLLITHHDWDHVAGNLELKLHFGCKVIGPAVEANNIPGIDIGVRDGDVIPIGSRDFKVIETPGHTLGHVCYWGQNDGVAFAGDALFTMGCGRVKEGTHEMMWASLCKIASLPPDTMIYCGHDYAVANARFAATIDPSNARLQARARQLASGEISIPTRLTDELATNPFLRADDPAIRASLGLAEAPASHVFGALRDRKDRF